VTILPAKFRDRFSGGLGEERLDLESADSCQRQPSKSMDKAGVRRGNAVAKCGMDGAEAEAAVEAKSPPNRQCN